MMKQITLQCDFCDWHVDRLHCGRKAIFEKTDQYVEFISPCIYPATMEITRIHGKLSTVVGFEGVSLMKYRLFFKEDRWRK